MVHDVLLAVAVVVAVLMVRAVWQMVRAVRRVRRRLLAVWDGVRRDAVTVDASWWANHRDRRRLWRAIAGAERAVAVARSAGAPTGDLPSVVRQLRSAAAVVDAGLVLPRRNPALLRQAESLAAAADDVTR